MDEEAGNVEERANATEDIKPDGDQAEQDSALPLPYRHDEDGKIIPLDGVQSLFLTGTAKPTPDRGGCTVLDVASNA